MRGGITMGSQVQSRRPPKRRASEENPSRGKELLTIDLNNYPDEDYEASNYFNGPSDTATSTHSQNVINVEDFHSAVAPICVDDIEDEIEILSEQVNQSGSHTNWGRAALENRSVDVIHIDLEQPIHAPGNAIVGDPLFGLALDSHHDGRSIDESQFFDFQSFEDFQNNHHIKIPLKGAIYSKTLCFDTHQSNDTLCSR